MKTADLTLPTHVLEAIARGQAEFSKSGRFGTNYPAETLREMSDDQKRQHFRDSIFNVIAQAAKERGSGQPPMVEQFRAACIIVDALESDGVPFGVGPNSRMNKALRKLLNADARKSSDNRKSRRKEVGAGATRSRLRQVRYIRYLEKQFIKEPPYSK